MHAKCEQLLDRPAGGVGQPRLAWRLLPKSLSREAYLTVFRDPDGNFVEFVGPKKK